MYHKVVILHIFYLLGIFFIVLVFTSQMAMFIDNFYYFFLTNAEIYVNPFDKLKSIARWNTPALWIVIIIEDAVFFEAFNPLVEKIKLNLR